MYPGLDTKLDIKGRVEVRRGAQDHVGDGSTSAKRPDSTAEKGWGWWDSAEDCTGGLQAKSRRRRRERKLCCGWIDRHTKRSRYQLWSRTPGSVIGWRVEVGVDTEQRRIW
ncbi:hypothetical protein MKX07_005288 [Trichoderma sp. CBMAI-0711]|nr:hypothetical protein MKX07_005288 [Trichoderma sp. CBMAI-0711]